MYICRIFIYKVLLKKLGPIILVILGQPINILYWFLVFLYNAVADAINIIGERRVLPTVELVLDKSTEKEKRYVD